jgi:hypothetical protein
VLRNGRNIVAQYGEIVMFAQILDGFRKMSESSWRMQEDVLKGWAQQWSAFPPMGTRTPNEWSSVAPKRWLDLTLDFMNGQRASLDVAYKSGIRLIEQALGATDARTPEDYRRVMEELWGQLFELYKQQSETQFRELYRWAAEFDPSRETRETRERAKS